MSMCTLVHFRNRFLGWIKSGLNVCCTCFILSITVPAHGVVAPNFYQIHQKVVDQSDKSRKRAIKTAFREVIVKLAGSTQVLYQPSLNIALQNPQPYVERFSYTTAEDGLYLLQLDFDETKIENLLSQLRLPEWDKDRPPLVMWVGIDNNHGRELLGQNNAQLSGFRQIIENMAQKRGLVTRWPLLDDQDQQTLSITDVWSLDMTTAVNASRRYNAQFVVLGKFALTPNGDWLGQWGVQRDGRAVWFDYRSNDISTSFESMIQQVSDNLGQTYAVEAGHNQSKTVVVEIEDVSNLYAFAQISNILNKLVAVNHVALRQAVPNRLVFEVDVQGGENQLASILRLQPNLRALPRPAPLATPDFQVSQLRPKAVADTDLTETLAENQLADVSEQIPQIMLKYRWTNQ